MQPTLVITAPAEGMIYINGRFAGETRPDAPLFAPVAPFGPVWLEYRPLTADTLTLARKIVLSGGAPLADSLSGELFATCWPGSITEIELSPPPIPENESETLILGGIPCRILRGRRTAIEIGHLSAELPGGARPLQLHRSGSAAALSGTADGRQFLLALSSDFTRQTGFLQADVIEFEEPGTLRAIEYFDDTAGHGTLERWRLDSAGLHRISSENIWKNGIPNRPSSGEEAARAAVEAALLERFDEAESYFMPGAQPSFPLENIPETGALCLPMKYGSPDTATSIALLQLEEENLARAVPLHYRAEFSGGEWRLTDLWT